MTFDTHATAVGPGLYCSFPPPCTCADVSANITACDPLPTSPASSWACDSQSCTGSCSTGTAPYVGVPAPNSAAAVDGTLGPLKGTSHAGASTKVCVDGDTGAMWLGAEPECTALPPPVCSSPTVPADAYVVCDSPAQGSTGAIYPAGTKCRYSCAPGSIGIIFDPPGGGLSFDVPVIGKFSLKAEYYGEITLTCGSDSQWSGKQVECVGK